MPRLVPEPAGPPHVSSHFARNSIMDVSRIFVGAGQGVSRAPVALHAPRLAVRSLRRRWIAPQAQLNNGDEQPGQQDGEPGSRTEQPGPAPPRRRSPALQTQTPEVEEPEERDLFIPIVVVLALAGYATTALIAWVEYPVTPELLRGGGSAVCIISCISLALRRPALDRLVAEGAREGNEVACLPPLPPPTRAAGKRGAIGTQVDFLFYISFEKQRLSSFGAAKVLSLRFPDRCDRRCSPPS